jgi:hypothetical protein
VFSFSYILVFEIFVYLRYLEYLLTVSFMFLCFSLADIKSARNLAEICSEMVSALNPRDRMVSISILKITSWARCSRYG